MFELLLIWIITAASLLIIARIEIFGVEIQSIRTALLVSLVLGILNALIRPILLFFSIPLLIFTFGLFTFVLNAIVFWLASKLVPGFDLRRGCLSALVGPIALSLLTTVMLAIVR